MYAFELNVPKYIKTIRHLVEARRRLVRVNRSLILNECLVVLTYLYTLPLAWFWYIGDVSFIWTHGQDELDSFLEELNRSNSYLKFTYESSKKSIPFLDLKMSLSNGNLSTDLDIKSTDRHQFLHYISHQFLHFIFALHFAFLHYLQSSPES